MRACHSATADDVHLVLELLLCPADERRRRAARLRRHLAQQADLPPGQRPAVPCPRAADLFVLLPSRLAEWLADVLPADDGYVERTAQRLERWLRSRGARCNRIAGCGLAASLHGSPAARLEKFRRPAQRRR